jgi:hypothetical protein
MAKRKRPVISHRDFVRDLGRGALGEDVAEVFFKSEFGVIAENVSEKNPDYDLKISKLDPCLAKRPRVVPAKLLRKIFRDSFGYSNKKELTVEVKFDEAAARYGNIFIEIFFDIDTGSPGTVFKCKADLLAWVIPARKKFKIYLIKRPEFLAWLFGYIFADDSLEYKTPGISPHARGIALPIKEMVNSPACLGEFELKL